MFALGHEQTCAAHKPMSALDQKGEVMPPGIRLRLKLLLNQTICWGGVLT
jgi:hypothetical protein